MATGFYVSRPDKVVALWVGLSVALMVVGIFAGLMAACAALRWVDGVALGVGLGISGFITLCFGLVMPARTEAGARAREAALGFREFLDKVESDRYRQMI